MVDVPQVRASDVATLTADQMRHVDEVIIDKLHITLPQMMENAGRSLARLVIELFGLGDVTVFVGAGGNGGGGLVAPRHLANAGMNVSVILSREQSEFSPVRYNQLDIVRRIGDHDAGATQGRTRQHRTGR